MKLNNENIWLTEKNDEIGKSLYEIPILDIYDHKQSTIYYKYGISEIENKFGEKGYIGQGYVTTLVAHENAISIFFLKYLKDKITELSVAHIDRKQIVRFEEKKTSNLIVVKREDTKHKAKYMLKNSTGLLGSLTGLATENKVSANTEEVDGVLYSLFYKDTNGKEQEIIMYSSNEFADKSNLFFNTYYKNELSEEAKKTVDNSSNCFIATACYKDLYAPEVIEFRNYRDNVLNKNYIGSVAVKLYYKISPFLYERLYNSPRITVFIKRILTIIYKFIK